MVTGRLPATIVPLTLVLLHPTPVQTVIGSACAVPWASDTIPKIASAKSDFFSPEKLGISSLLCVTKLSATLKAWAFEAADKSYGRLGDESRRGKCVLRHNQPNRTLSRVESVSHWHVPACKQRVGQHTNKRDCHFQR